MINECTQCDTRLLLVRVLVFPPDPESNTLASLLFPLALHLPLLERVGWAEQRQQSLAKWAFFPTLQVLGSVILMLRRFLWFVEVLRCPIYTHWSRAPPSLLSPFALPLLPLPFPDPYLPKLDVSMGHLCDHHAVSLEWTGFCRCPPFSSTQHDFRSQGFVTVSLLRSIVM